MEYKEFRKQFEDRLKDKRYQKEIGFKSFEFVDDGKDWFVVEITDKFATYSILVEMLGAQCDGCMNSRIVATKYDEVDDLVLSNDDEGIGFAEYEWEANPDFEAVMDEILYQAMDDGSMEEAFKEMNKLKNKVESLEYNFDAFQHSPQILATFLSNLSSNYE